MKKKDIIHRDFKPQNVMVCKNENYKLLDYQIQLLDFGFAKEYKESLNDKQILGSPHYVAPEALGQSYGFASDVWSIGIMLFFTIAMEYPFEGKSDEELFKSIREDELTFFPEKAWEDVPAELKELIEDMLK